MKWLTHLSQKAEQAIDTAETAIAEEKQTLKNNEKNLEAKLNTAEDTVHQDQQNLKQSIQHKADSLKTDTEALENHLKTTETNIEQTIKQKIDTLETNTLALEDNVSQAYEHIKHSGEQKLDTLKDTVENAEHTIEQHYTQAKQKLNHATDTVKADINTASHALNDEIEKAHEKFDALQNTIQASSKQAEEKLEDLIHNKPAQILNHIKQSIKQFYSTASGIGQPSSANTNSTHKPKSGQWQHLALLAAINILVYLAHTGAISHSSMWLFGEHVDTINRAYLHTAGTQTTELVTTLSGIKMVLAVLQSSQGGINFIIDVQIQLGQLLSPLIDTINYAWQFSIAALSAIELLKLILDSNKLSMVPALTLLCILLGIRFAMQNHLKPLANIITQTARAMAFVVVLTHLLIPASLYITATTSALLLTPYKTQVSKGFSDFHQQLPQHNANEDLKDQVKGNMQHFQKHSQLHQHGPHLVGLTITHFIISLVEYMLIPFVLMFALVKLCLRWFRFTTGQ